MKPMNYREMALVNHGPAAIAEAESAGIPVPFWGIGGRITTLTGTVEISVQYKEEPTDAHLAEIREAAASLIGREVIADSLCVTLCWDPREWEGHTYR